MGKVGTDLERAGFLEGEAFIDLAEVELLLDFAEWMLENVSGVWSQASFEDKQRLQWAVFPAGLMVSGKDLEPQRPLFFKQFERDQ